MADDLATIGYKADLTGINQINKGLDKVGTTSSKTASKMTDSMGKVGRSAGQAGIQVQQLVGQIQMGTSPMVALSQQAADLGIVLGAPLLGAIAGISASIGAAFLPALFSAEDALDGVEESARNLTQAQKELFEERNKEKVSELTAQLSNQREELEKIQKAYDYVRQTQGIALDQPLIGYESQLTEARAAIDTTEQKLSKLTDTSVEAGEEVFKLAESYRNKTAALSADAEEMEKRLALQQLDKNATEEQREELEKEISLYYEKQRAVKSEIEQQRLVEISRAKELAQIQSQQKAYQKWIESVENAADPSKVVREEIEKINEAMEAGDLAITTGTARIKQLEDQLNSTAVAAEKLNSVLSDDEYNIYAAYSAYGAAMVEAQKSTTELVSDANYGNPFEEMTNGAKDALSAVQNLSTQGSSDYQKLGVAIQAVSAIQAVYAVMNQSNGDPYSAFGRMASMAATVAALGYSVGSLSGSLDEDESATNQAEQGLNEWNEKASSIDDSVSSMESNTDKLVGINTDMLDALTTLQSDLLSAAGIVARDTVTPEVNQSELGLIDFSSMIFDPAKLLGFSFLGDFIGDAIGGLLGGSSSVKDEGISIIGGSLSQLMDDVTVQAFQSVSYKKWAFGSTKSKTVTETLSDSVSSQFEAVFSSLADTVFSGASALGMNTTAITNAINSFVIDTIEISLKDLTVDEQAEALEDVFSQVFNNLTEAVIPWLDELQDTGEDLGETLSRVATEVSIANLLIEQVGVSFGRLSTKNFAFAADNIATLVGGVDDLADSVSSFIDSFASDETKLEIYSDAVSDALSAVGLALPDSAEGFWDLASTINASTEAGQEQIATLLNITDTAAEYYDLLESTEESLNDLSDSFVSTILDIYDLSEATEAMSLDAALAAARLGDFSLAEALDSSDYNLTASNYATKAAYDIAQAEAANKLLEIAELAADETSVEEEQLSVLMQINESIIAGYGNQGSATMTSEISSLNAIMTKTQELSEAAVRLNAKMSSNLDRIARVGIPTYE